MILALAAALAIVVQDHASLRSAAQANAPELTTLWQGDLLEIVRMRTFEHNGRVQICYEGELYRRVLATPRATPEERAHAALGLTRPDCIDPDMSSVLRFSVDDQRRALLEAIDEQPLDAMTRSRLHARRSEVWATIAFEQARRGEPAAPAAQRALSSLLDVSPNDLGDDGRAEYLDAILRTSAIRWATATPRPQEGPLTLAASAGDPGQTCLTLTDARRPHSPPLTRRCTYGIPWMASALSVPQGPALVLAVQPLEAWRELWVFHQVGATWAVDVISPGTDDPEEGYAEFAGFAPATRRLLVAREVNEHGRFRRSFEEFRLDDLALVRQASSPELLRDFGRWQDAAWRRDTLALH